jgi:urease accessory protein
MLSIEHDAPAGSAVDDRLSLPFELRQKSRQRARLASGEEVAIDLPRGRLLRGGDLLLASDGRVVQVIAAPELVSQASAADPRSLARGAYHLGNRHVPLEVGEGFLRYQHDHVLDRMVRGLGLEVGSEQAPFEPEGGAYGQGHAHGHEHEHGHEHKHGGQA